MKILHTADIHLKEFGDDRWDALQKVIEVGKKEGIEILVISGDLFDNTFDSENLRPKIREIFSNNGFRILLLAGNHDIDAYKSGMYFGDDAFILTDLETPFEYKDLLIWGLPFEPIEGEKILHKLRSLIDRLSTDRKNILVYHGELLDAFFSRADLGDEGEERYMPVKLNYFKDLNLDYILAGHFHSNFTIRQLEKGGFFVYPGSPISITKRETGQRKVNLFEVGKPPKEVLLDTPHFEEIDVELDPFEARSPVEIVMTCLKKLHPKARINLTFRGFVNCNALGTNETELIKQIEKEIGSQCYEKPIYEFRDISTTLEDDLFKDFLSKLKQVSYSEEKKKEMCDLAIKAVMESRV